MRSKVQAILSTGSQVVVFSSVSTPMVVRQAFDAGALAFMPKTVGADGLTMAVRAAARGEKFVLPELAHVLAAPGPQIRLTQREHEAVSLYVGSSGGTMADVAASMGIGVDGVKKLLNSVRRKARTGRCFPQQAGVWQNFARRRTIDLWSAIQPLKKRPARIRMTGAGRWQRR